MPSEWTVDTLKAHFDQRLADQEKAVDAALAAAKEATQKAESAAERRFDALNEMRAMVNDQAALYLTRNEYEAKHEGLVQKVDTLQKVGAAGEGHDEGLNKAWGLLIGAVGLLGALVAIWIAVGGR